MIEQCIRVHCVRSSVMGPDELSHAGTSNASLGHGRTIPSALDTASISVWIDKMEDRQFDVEGCRVDMLFPAK